MSKKYTHFIGLTNKSIKKHWAIKMINKIIFSKWEKVTDLEFQKREKYLENQQCYIGSPKGTKTKQYHKME